MRVANFSIRLLWTKSVYKFLRRWGLIYYRRNLIFRDYAKYYDREGKAGSAPGYTGTTRGCARLSVDQYTFVEEGLRWALGSRARSANKVPARAEGPRFTYFVLYTKISTLPLSLFLWTNAPHKTVLHRDPVHHKLTYSLCRVNIKVDLILSLPIFTETAQ